MTSFDGIDKLINLFRELESIDGKKINEVIFPLESVISDTPDKAMQRAAYESFLKKEEIEEEQIDIIAENFLGDMLRKHLG
jgi:hypothetical protein